MSSKDEVLEILERCLQSEERAIALYAQHAGRPPSFFGFDDVGQTRIQELLVRLKTESESHRETYRRLIATVEAAKQNDF